MKVHFCVMECITTGVVLITVCTFVKTHQTVHLKWLHLVVCELYLDKGGFYVSILAVLDLHGGPWAFSSGGVWASLVEHGLSSCGTQA